MNPLSAVVTTAALIAFLLLLSVGLLLVGIALDIVDGNLVISTISGILTSVGSLDRSFAVIFAASIGIVLLAIFLMLIAAIRRTTGSTYLIKDFSDGQLTIDRRTVQKFVEQIASNVIGVRLADSSVKFRGGKLVVRCNILIDRQTIVEEVSNEVRRAVMEQVPHHIGVPVSTCNVRVKINANRATRPVLH